MKKDSSKILISIAVVLLIGVVFYFFGYKKPKVVEQPVGAPVDQQEITQPAKSDTPRVNINTENKSLFDKKMKEASSYFVKGDYRSAVTAYNQALVITKSEHAYAGLYSANLALKDYTNAEKSILSAIELNPKSSDYWSWYLVLLSDAMKVSRAKLDAVYNDAYNKVPDNRKVNIATAYARILESLGDYVGAIGEWQKAITLNPSMKDAYQAEIDALKAKSQ